MTAINPKVAIGHFENMLGPDPLKEDAKELSDLTTFLESTISPVANIGPMVKDRFVFIKPNLNFVPDKLNPHIMTDPRLLLALIRLIHKYNPRRIAIGEKPGQKRSSQSAYELLKSHFSIPSYVELLEIDMLPRVEVATATRLVSAKLSLPKSYLEADIVVDMPKMKTHSLTDVSLGLKNLFGLLTDEERMRHHNEDIDSKLVDLLSVRQPDLTVVDGIFGLEGQGPLYGTPRKSGIIVAGNECLATDVVTAFLMGFEPCRIGHIGTAGQHGLGKVDLDQIEIAGEDPVKLRQDFIRADIDFNPFINIAHIIKGKSVPKGYLNAISHSLERAFYEDLKLIPLNIYAGRFDNARPEKRSIIFGDLTSSSVSCSDCIVIKGHPPTAFSLYDVIKQLFVR